MTTAFNLCRRGMKKRPPAEITPDRQEEPLHDRIDLVRALGRLPLRQRQAVILFYLADHPVSAVADLMGLSEGAVKTHLSRARDALRASLEVADA